MSKMGQYVLEHQVDDPNELQGEELIEYNDYLDMVNESIAHAIHDDKLKPEPEQNHENR